MFRFSCRLTFHAPRQFVLSVLGIRVYWPQIDAARGLSIRNHFSCSQIATDPLCVIYSTVRYRTTEMYAMKFLSFLAASASLASAFSPSPAFSSTRQQQQQQQSVTELYAAQIQFVRGLEEGVVPDVKLTRARDGSSGVATFQFKNPQVFDASTASKGEVTGMFMVDDEGEISTTDVNARFANGKPQAIEATYVMKSPQEWDRFMRFMESYGEANGLGFTKA